MKLAWVLNLDAELELLRDKPGYVPQQKLLAQLAEHGRCSRALLGPHDLLIAPEQPLPAAGADLRHYLGRAWCPTPRAVALLAAHGVRCEPHPSASVLRRVNHRLFAHELGGGLEAQRYVGDRAALAKVLGSHDQRWLLKRPLSFAGRGQLRVMGPLTEKQWSWVDASFEKEGLIVEPLVEPTFEVSLHGFVWPSGEHQLGRPCTQDVSTRGTFRGARLSRDDELSDRELASLEERGLAVAQGLHRAGYFGPFGIDAYRYHHAGRERFCALSEINARYTLAFATGFPVHPSRLSLFQDPLEPRLA